MQGRNSISIGYDRDLSLNDAVRLGNAATNSIGGHVNWTAISDARFKHKVQENVPGLAFVNQLRPVSYHFDLQALYAFENKPIPEDLEEAVAEKEKITYTGFLAQEVEKAAQELGYAFSGVDPPEAPSQHAYGLRYAEFVVPLVKASQELEAKIVEQDRILAAQQPLLEQQQAELARYQKLLAQMKTRLEAVEQGIRQLEKKPTLTQNKQQKP